jgi:hypothetical protein
MAGSVYDDLQSKKNQLIRKGLDGSVFVAPFTADAIDTLTDDADMLLKALPTGYDDLGWLSEDGAQYSSDVETSDITGWGGIEPLRSDITQDTTTLEVAALETKLITIGLYTGADTSTITANATTGEVSIEKPARPSVRYYRVLSIAVDLSDAGEIYIARFLPRARVTDKSDQPHQSSDDEPITWGVTFTSYVDSTLGYSERYLFGGPGWNALLADMDIPTA